VQRVRQKPYAQFRVPVKTYAQFRIPVKTHAQFRIPVKTHAQFRMPSKYDRQGPRVPPGTARGSCGIVNDRAVIVNDRARPVHAHVHARLDAPGIL
jgi:hypothetical protein